MLNGAAARISALISLALHIGILWLVLGSARRDEKWSEPESLTWVEPLPGQSPQPPPILPPPPIAASSAAPSTEAPSRTPRSKRIARPAVPEPSGAAATGASEQSAVDPKSTEGEPSGVTGGEEAPGPLQPLAEEGGADERSVRTAGPPQFSIWMRSSALERSGLTRAAITLLMAVPGLRDSFRGSGLEPVSDLALLRVFLPGLRAEHLMLAGVHREGEQALRDTAARIAAMRAAKLDWRGDSELRATAWVDGSGVDRGLALHGGAFVIAARERMPSILGETSAAARVLGLSRMRESVSLIAMIERVDLYFPRFAACGLQGLRVSVATYRGVHRLIVTADYASRWAAKQAPACLDGLEPDGASTQLRAWLRRAEVSSSGQRTELRTEASKQEVELLLDGLSWALRRVRV